MTGRTRSARFQPKGLRSAALLLFLLAISWAANAADKDPLRPTDTSSPRATLQDFVETTDDVYRRMSEVLEEYGKSDRLYLSHDEQQKQIGALREAPKIARLLDVSGIAPVLKDTVTVERILQLKEILDRIDIPAFADIPDRGSDGAATVEAVEAAEHGNRHRSHRERAACRRISGVRRNDRSPSGVL